MLIEEAKISVELNHPNIGQVFDLGRIDDTYFIAMEFIEGVDAFKLMVRASEQQVTIPLETCLHVVREVCAGLDYAHRKCDASGRPLEIIHRDISPQNILISYAGDVKIIDFGIAKATLRHQETEVGIIKGKYYYMSPEQAWGKRVDQRTDIFSAGIILYELLVGEMLYSEQNLDRLLARVRTADIDGPSKRRDDIPPELDQLVLKALALKPDDRFQSAAELGSRIEQLLQRLQSDYPPARLASLVSQLLGDSAPAEEDADELDHGGEVVNREDFHTSTVQDGGSLLFDLMQLKGGTRKAPAAAGHPCATGGHTAINGGTATPRPSTKRLAALWEGDETDDEDQMAPPVGPTHQKGPKGFHRRGAHVVTRELNTGTEGTQNGGSASSLSEAVAEPRRPGDAVQGRSQAPRTVPFGPAVDDEPVDPGASPDPDGDEYLDDDAPPTQVQLVPIPGLISPPPTEVANASDLFEVDEADAEEDLRHDADLTVVDHSASESADSVSPHMSTTHPRASEPPARTRADAPAITDQENDNEPEELSATKSLFEIFGTPRSDDEEQTVVRSPRHDAPPTVVQTAPPVPPAVPPPVPPPRAKAPPPPPPPHEAATQVPTPGHPLPAVPVPPTAVPTGPGNPEPETTPRQGEGLERQPSHPARPITSGTPPTTRTIIGTQQTLLARRRRHLWLGLAGAILCGALTAGLLSWSPGSTVARLDIRSHPPGATILFDDQPFGATTPTVIDQLKIGGTHQVELRLEGFAPWREEVELNSHEVRQIAVLMPLRGKLRVESRPPGAVIYVDGVYQGTTPQVLEGLDINREIRIQARHQSQTKATDFVWNGRVEATVEFNFMPPTGPSAQEAPQKNQPRRKARRRARERRSNRN
jgi:hypothetical protein